MAETTRLLRDLVAIPSINPMGRSLQGPEIYEHRVTDYLAEFFRTLGVAYQRQTCAPLRENIVAVYEPSGATATLVFEAHQDTVPTDNMTIDPFGAVIDNGYLYGRGACDIKGGMAAMLAAFARVVRVQPAGACRLIMACTVDEESTFLGVQRLVRDDLRGGRTGKVGAVVAEPTGLNIVSSHKGVARWHLTTSGRSCHSSRPELGSNAIYHMAELLPLIRDYAEELLLSQSHPLLGPPTLSVGRIEGGTSVNTVPDRCRIEIDRRLLPGEQALAARDQFDVFLRRHVRADLSFACSDLWLTCPPLSAEHSPDLVARLGEAINTVIGRHEVHAVPYGTDASTIAAAGYPAVVFGPGDIAKAHTCDENVPLTEVDQASEILFRLATAWSDELAA
jgi:acetylornithine deacetylase